MEVVHLNQKQLAMYNIGNPHSIMWQQQHERGALRLPQLIRRRYGKSSGSGLGFEVVTPPQFNKLLRSLSIRKR